MKITNENYFSLEAQREYSTNSQRTTFIDCPAQWKAYIDGKFKPVHKIYYDHGTYVDLALTEPAHVFKQWKEDNRHLIIGKYGRFKAYDNLDLAIQIVRDEPLMMKYLKGDGQCIIVLDDFHGCKIKMKLDCLNLIEGFLTDLKTTMSLHKLVWMESQEGKNMKVPFYDAYDYWTQLALYREGVWIKHGVDVKVFLAVIEKEYPFDRDVFDMTVEDHLELCVENTIPVFQEMQRIKDDDMDPDELRHCGVCEYCAETKSLIEPKEIYPV